MERMNFSEKVEFADGYYKWLERESAKLPDGKRVKDCPESVITYYQTAYGKEPREDLPPALANAREMVYTQVGRCDIIGHDRYKGYEWVILNLGSHPTAYVKLTKEESKKLEGRDYFYDIDVHGGCTWLDTFVPVDSSDKSQFANDGRLWFGWDYAHFGDYMSFHTKLGGKKYSIVEIYEDVKSVIDQLDNFDWNKIEVEDGRD